MSHLRLLRLFFCFGFCVVARACFFFLRRFGGEFHRADEQAVKMPPLSSVLRKNSHVCGQPDVPLVNAVNQPIKSFVYSGLPKGLKNHDAVLVMR